MSTPTKVVLSTIVLTLVIILGIMINMAVA